MQEYKITIANRDEKVVTGIAQIQHLSDAERNGRANSFFWKAAISGCVAVIIPPHVLYPVIGLAVAFIGSKLIRKQRYIFLEGKAECPDCGAEQLLPKSNDEFPFIHFCSACRCRTEVTCAELTDN